MKKTTDCYHSMGHLSRQQCTHDLWWSEKKLHQTKPWQCCISVSTHMCFPSLKKHQEKKIVCSRISSWKLLKKPNWLNEVRKQRDEVCYFCRPFDPWGKGRHKKKMFFFFRKTPKFWDPHPPSSSNSEAPVFSDKEISELARPTPPFGEKFRNILSFFLIKSLWIGWEPPF